MSIKSNIRAFVGKMRDYKKMREQDRDMRRREDAEVRSDPRFHNAKPLIRHVPSALRVLDEDEMRLKVALAILTSGRTSTTCVMASNNTIKEFTAPSQVLEQMETIKEVRAGTNTMLRHFALHPDHHLMAPTLSSRSSA